jgi:hypothetical protein
MSALNPCYKPLSLTAPQIRLVTIKPGPWEGDIICSLETVYLNDHRPYEALSYTWGSPFPWDGPEPIWPDREKPIVLDGQQVKVKENLESALRHLRGNRPRVMWIDAICINQNDTDEKNLQVRRMREIYERAVKTVIWLGNATPRSSSCFRSLARLDISNFVLGPGDEECSGDRIRDLRVIGSRSWWRRAWVIQELAVSKNPILKAGFDELPWSRLKLPNLTLKWLLALTTTHPDRFHKDFHRMHDMKTSFQRGKSLTITQLVTSHREALATDPRDLLFALVGLTADPMTPLLIPDYSLTTWEVFRNFVQHSIAEDDSLDIICLSNSFVEGADRPSWVPDLADRNIDLYPNPLLESTYNGDKLFGNFDGRPRYPEEKYGFEASSDSSPQISIFRTDFTLVAKGIHFDKIEAVGGSLTGYPANIAGILESWEEILLEKFESQLHSDGHDRTPTISSITDFFSNMFRSQLKYNGQLTIGAFWTLPRRLQLISRRLRRPITDGIYIGGGGIREAYVRTLLTDRNPNGTRLTDAEYAKRWTHRKPVAEFIDDELQVAATLRLIYRRRLFVSENGYIGLVPSNAQPGDMICVLFGCSVPVIIRKLNNHHVFIGASYVHGIMDGQIITKLSEGSLTEEQFTLK